MIALVILLTLMHSMHCERRLYLLRTLMRGALIDFGLLSVFAGLILAAHWLNGARADVLAFRWHWLSDRKTLAS